MDLPGYGGLCENVGAACFTRPLCTLLPSLFCLPLQLEPKQLIRNVKGACLAARLPWMDDSQPPILQQVRANNMFYRAPWFDAVEVRRIGRAGNIEHAFAQLCLLFQANVRSEEGTKVLATMFCCDCALSFLYTYEST